MKIGIGSGGILDTLGLEAGFAAMKDAGIEVVDYDFCHYFVCKDTMDEAYLEELLDEERISKYFSEMKEAAAKYGIGFGQCHAPYPTYVPRKERETAIMQKFVRKSIELCRFLECNHLIIHPLFDGSNRFPSLTQKQEQELNMTFFTDLIPELKKYHVTCCLENMYSMDWGTKKCYFGSCSDMNEAVWYIDTLNEKAGEKRFAFCADIGHLIILGIDPCFAFEKLGHRLEALHVHDNDGMNDEHIAPYLGVVNWRRFIKGLRENGYKGNISFETANSCRMYPKELVPDSVKMIAAIGRYFREQVLAEQR